MLGAMRRSSRLRSPAATALVTETARKSTKGSTKEEPAKKPHRKTRNTVEKSAQKDTSIEEKSATKRKVSSAEPPKQAKQAKKAKVVRKKGRSEELKPIQDIEAYLRKEGFLRIAGADEAGRGPLAGPVVAAACIVPEHVRFDGVQDSKKLSEADRERLFSEITSHPEVIYAVTVVSHTEIDQVNILEAALLGMERSIRSLSTQPDFILVDGPHLPQNLPIENAAAVVKGDARVYSISCASILAKVQRDKIMVEMHDKYPQYNFAKHKGYPSPEHRALLAKLGPCEIHRRSFAPVQRALQALHESKS